METFSLPIIRSILAMKINYSWAEIAQSLNDDYQSTLTGEAVRKRIQRFKRRKYFTYLAVWYYVRIIN